MSREPVDEHRRAVATRPIHGQRRRGAGRADAGGVPGRRRTGAGGRGGGPAVRHHPGRARQLADGSLPADGRSARCRHRTAGPHRTRVWPRSTMATGPVGHSRTWPARICGARSRPTRRPPSSPAARAWRRSACGRSRPSAALIAGARPRRGHPGLFPRRRHQVHPGRRAGTAPGRLPAHHGGAGVAVRRPVHATPAVRRADQRLG